MNDRVQLPKSRAATTEFVQPARRVAYEVIAAVRESDAYANLLLPTRIQRAALNTADAALATELTYGTLRMQGFYDRVIALAANRSVDAIDPAILDVLRLGTHQLLATRVATHAAVNESVSIAKQVGSRSATGFTNGVLRTISRSSAEEWRERVLDGAAGVDDRLAAEHSHPSWVVRAFRQALKAEGREDEIEDLLAANNVPAKVNMVALPGIATADDESLLGTKDAYAPTGYVLAGGDPYHLMTQAKGRIRVQDEGSQLAALALSHARPIESGERWLDLCAGPGGKAALLAAEARTHGAELVANELVHSRATLVRNALAAIPENVEVWELDGTRIAELHPGEFDRILLDAPCTGLGALRRRPEARWRKQPKDVAELAGLQSGLIDAALGALKPGGVLAYVTCSPHTAETRGIVATALKKWAGTVNALDTAAVVQSLSNSELDLAGDPSSVQLWPHRHGTDAMFITLLERLPD
ncbi:RsmB/NOP family class I SAM-dependent RNA methyltransferase [Cryobacterium psychrophilum]|uniref:rRNA small subunit methyltransferase B n=1 Tax=Cryobacterium psychrophilum TaxID=41988 RepID=A0A4Y8KQC1_9MICO|nr:transcription antitermination factor NusB [Cryobacterium psychrophilum]TDW28615.1 16S rRNA (cytosine967-C5)-methyltransferase [Cryobacterium psychrophilum]TFD80389.1 rRNA small subunit methyltransferase B [Cryobacterium psychrophilum]